MALNDQLRIPDAAKKDPRSLELLRIWIADQDQHVSLRVGVWEDPFAWGLVLADLAGHIANTYMQQPEAQSEGEQQPGRQQNGKKKMTRAEVLERIVDGFDAEMAGPSDETVGEVLE